MASALVYVVDDDESVRTSLARLLRAAQLAVTTLDSARTFLDCEPHPGPVCVVLDVRMPGLDGLELQEALRGRPEQIVFLSGYGNVPMCAQAMKNGAVDFLIKPVGSEELLAAVHRALEQSATAHQRAAERAAVRARLDTLTPREFEVLQHVIAGMLNKQIADRLGTAIKTIKIHRGRLMFKMRAASVSELVRLAQVGGVGPAPAA